MAWLPEDTLLGTHAELESFSHSIQYYIEGAAGDPEADPPVEGGEDVYYNVRIIPQQNNPDTVTFTTGDPGIISGYYKGIFNDSLTTRAPDGTLTTITTLSPPEGSVFSKVSRNNVYEVISFKADTTRSRTLTYLAEALDEDNEVISSQVYTILAQDRNWTPGLIALKELVSYASSK
jgi:hypothetical protein